MFLNTIRTDTAEKDKPRNHHCLDTIRPKIRFKFGRGSYTSKRYVRIYRIGGDGNGVPHECLCISARGKLWRIVPTGPKSASCNLTAPALVDFGSRQKAREEAQMLAPVATLAKLGIERPSRPKSKTVCLQEEVSELRSQLAEVTAVLDEYRNGSR